MSEEELSELRRRIERLEQALFPLERPMPYQPLQPAPYPWGHSQKCAVCGILLGPAMGYVCPHNNCPTGLGG